MVASSTSTRRGRQTRYHSSARRGRKSGGCCDGGVTSTLSSEDVYALSGTSTHCVTASCPAYTSILIFLVVLYGTALALNYTFRWGFMRKAGSSATDANNLDITSAFLYSLLWTAIVLILIALVVRCKRCMKLEGDDGTFYIGSTQRSLEERFRGHKEVSALASEVQQKVTKHYTKLGWEHVRIVEVHKQVSSREDLNREEGKLISENISNPLCLNDRVAGRYETREERHKRDYAERHGVRVTCECGESVVQIYLEKHKLRETHIAKMRIKEQPLVAENPEELVQCECSSMVKRCNFVYHRTTERHIWYLRSKLLPELVLKVSVPHPCSPPEGAEPGKEYRICQCGVTIIRKQFWFHVSTLKHKKNMVIKLGLIPEESLVTLPQEKKNQEKVLCPCGVMVSVVNMKEHQTRLKHIGRMKCLPETVTIPATVISGTHPAKLSGRNSKMTCECGIQMLSRCLPLHLKSATHKEKMKRRETGQVSPVKGLERREEVLTCECGVKITRGNLSSHLKRDGHKRWEEFQAQIPVL